MGESGVSGTWVLTFRCVRFYHGGVTYRRLTALALVFSLGLAACSAASGQGSYGDAGSPGAGSDLLPISPEALPLMDVAGYQELLAQLHGTPVVVNVWASWCGPCNQEAPLLHQGAIDQPGVQFLGVDILDSREGAIGFIRRYSLPYPSLFNPSGTIRDSLGVIGQPDTLFYDAEGVLQAQVIGPLTQASLDHNLAKIAA